MSAGENIDELIDFAGGETDWLEFKASLFARLQDPWMCRAFSDGKRIAIRGLFRNVFFSFS